MKNTKLLSIVLAALISCGTLSSCGADEQQTAPEATAAETTAAETTAETTPAEPAAAVLTSDTVKLLGRTHLIDDTLWCGFSGTGAEFEYTGKKLDITFAADSAAAGNMDNRARAAVYVNGERVLDEMLDMPKETFTVFESDSAETVNVKIVKLSETAMSTFGIMPIELGEGETIAPAAEKAHKIEFIGDSITCGYGVDDEDKTHHFSTATEDVTKAYAYKTAESLDADYSMVSISGYGVISGYTNDPNVKVDAQTIPQYYDNLGFSYNKFANSQSPQDIEWDFSCFTPDVVVINLGTNDESYCKANLEKQAEFVEGYKQLLTDIRAKNPDAEIFCAFGVMGAGMLTSVMEAAITFSEETGDTKVHYVQLPTQDGSLGYAADWHPTEATHELAAEVMVNEIKTVMGW